MHISEHYINPSLHVRRKLIKIISTPQPNRVLINKLTHIRLIVPEEVVMQPGLSRSSGFIVSFRLLRWSSCGPVPKIRAYRSCPKSGSEISYGLQFANYFNLDMYRMPFPIITIKFFYII